MIKNVYSVGQVNNYIKNMFAQDFLLHQVCVKGEVSNCKYHASGHIYFTLKDSTGVIKAVMFAGNRKGLRFVMKEGDKVLVTGSIQVYERDGVYQIYANEIELDGEGNLFLKFEALKRELEEMGMFSDEYKRPIPKYAKTIGIVTASTGAAVQDIKNIAKRRNPFVQLILYPAQVQGEGAAESIVQGIYALEQQNVDVMIVGRGGGSIEDLWAFNEEIVARAIFDCSVPIISAVGHQTDWTIADYVADMRAPTPSAAAELAVFDYAQVQRELVECKHKLFLEMKRKLDVTRATLENKGMRLKLFRPQNRLLENRHRLMNLENALTTQMGHKLQEKKHKLALLASALEHVSPAKKLSQGYAFVLKADGKSLTGIGDVKVNEELSVHLIDGVVSARVTKIDAPK